MDRKPDDKPQFDKFNRLRATLKLMMTKRDLTSESES